MKNNKYKLFTIFLVLLFSIFALMFFMKKDKVLIKLKDKDPAITAYTLVSKDTLIDWVDDDASDFDALKFYLKNDDFEEFDIETEIKNIYGAFDLELLDENMIPFGQEFSLRYQAIKDDQQNDVLVHKKLDFEPEILIFDSMDQEISGQESYTINSGDDLDKVLAFYGAYYRFEDQKNIIELDKNHDIKIDEAGEYTLSLSNQEFSFEKELTIEVDENIDVHDPENTGKSDLSRVDVLVNKQYHLDENDIPPLKTIPLNYTSVENNQAQPEAVDAFIELVDTMKEETGNIVLAYSTYRSYSYQVGLFNTFANREGIEAANKFSARAGQSEHQTGLAIDVVKPGLYMDDFGISEESDWVAANAHRFGFIIRFPEGKEAITGYQYEPWHLRYLGKDLAQKVKDSGLTYDEYWLKYIR